MTHRPLTDNDVSLPQFRALANTMPALAWMAQPDGWIFWYNRRWYDYTGTTPDEMAGWGWQSVHHPETLPSVLEKWTAAIVNAEPFQMTFPLRGKDGIFRPFLTRTEPLWEDGKLVGWFGNNTEVSEQEQARERLQLMVNELNHRVKNTLATIQSMARQSFASAPPEMRERFDERLIALSNVHDVLTRESWTQASVAAVVDAAIASFGAERFDVSGTAVAVEPNLASGLAMTLHELCTNAVKYGALSVPGGRVTIAWTVEQDGGGQPLLHMLWTEGGGPPVVEPERRGFGLKLIQRALQSDRGATVDHRFEPGGVRCAMTLPLGVEVLR